MSPFLSMAKKKDGSRGEPASFLLIILVLSAAVLLAGFTYSAAFQKSPALAEISIGGRNYNVYLAITPEQQEKGLMNVTSIGDCYGNGNCLGMLFVGPNPACFWMKDTILPLKQYWISGNVISYVWTGVPESTQTICAQGNFVLETNTSTNLTIGEGFALVREFG